MRHSILTAAGCAMIVAVASLEGIVPGCGRDSTTSESDASSDASSDGSSDPSRSDAAGEQAAGAARLIARLVGPEGAGEEKPASGSATVQVDVSEIELVDPARVGEQPAPGQGHLRYRVDGGLVVATTATSLGFHDLSPGRHEIEVVLARNDHQPIGPRRTLAVEIPAGTRELPAAGKPGATNPASLTARLVDRDAKARSGAAIVEVTATGIELVDPLAAGSEPRIGQGHLHYRVDEGPRWWRRP